MSVIIPVSRTDRIGLRLRVHTTCLPYTIPVVNSKHIIAPESSCLPLRQRKLLKINAPMIVAILEGKETGVCSAYWKDYPPRYTRERIDSSRWNQGWLTYMVNMLQVCQEALGRLWMVSQMSTVTARLTLSNLKIWTSREGYCLHQVLDEEYLLLLVRVVNWTWKGFVIERQTKFAGT